MSNSDKPLFGPISIEGSHPFLAGPPPTFVNIHGAKSPVYFYKTSQDDPYYHRSWHDLEYLYINNLIPLAQEENLEDSSSLGDIANQSIVHYKIGFIESGEQVRVTFFFSTPPGMQNKVQIFEDTVLKDEYTTPLVYDWWEGSRSILVTGEGKRKSVFFRPTRRLASVPPFFVFFKGVEAVWI